MGALSGCCVLDLADEKGMLCTKILSDMGAEVICIEKPGISNSRNNADYCYLNTGKRSISLNLEKKTGQNLLRRLVKTVDVLVETEAPGYLASLGLGYKDLSEINTGLVMAAITHFGQNGPYWNYKSYDLVVGALGGWMSVCGEPRAPLKLFGNQAYHTASLFAANGILLALWHRRTTGRGQYIDISVMECAAATLDHVLVRSFYEGVVSKRQGSRHWNNTFRIFPCRDGYILLSLNQQWETLIEWLMSEGMAEDLADKKWRNEEERVGGIDHVIEVLERWTLSHNVGELVEKGQLMHFPWAKVTSISELLKGPQLIERNYFTEIEHPESGRKCKTAGVPVKMSGSPWRAGGKVPEAGEHNLEIYHGLLGLSEREIKALIKTGVI
jgi:crotonobetainyl-CoA:carnitine CoA-transferase CaiB-like acyl-CoA transferase